MNKKELMKKMKGRDFDGLKKLLEDEKEKTLPLHSEEREFVLAEASRSATMVTDILWVAAHSPADSYAEDLAYKKLSTYTLSAENIREIYEAGQRGDDMRLVNIAAEQAHRKGITIRSTFL